jgi:hypothetical protein
MPRLESPCKSSLALSTSEDYTISILWLSARSHTVPSLPGLCTQYAKATVRLFNIQLQESPSLRTETGQSCFSLTVLPTDLNLTKDPLINIIDPIVEVRQPGTSPND